MAKNGKQYAKISGTWQQIKPSYNDLTDIPSTFTPATHEHSFDDITSGTLTFGSDGYTIDTNYYHTWTREYTVNTLAPATLLYKDGGALPNGGVYRFTAHIAGTGTDQMAQAVFWNANGTWKVNVTGQSGTSSNHPEFIVSGGVPKLIIDHSSNYTISVLGERMEMQEGTGTDNAQFAFGAGSYLSSVDGVLRYNSGGGSDYTAGSPLATESYADTKVSKSGDTMTGNLRIDSGSFASLILDRTTTGSGSIVQFENNNGVIGGVGAFGDDGLQFRNTDGTQMVIDASNNVGIGTTSPAQKLDVSGNIAVSGTVDGVDISAFKTSYDNHTHDDRYYTETESDDRFLKNLSQTLDLSTLDNNTYYPVTIPINLITNFKIEVNLNSGTVPSWSTHPVGFALVLSWTSNPNGWGTVQIERVVHQWSENWTSGTIVGGITQMGNSNTEVVYLRGGGKYFLRTSNYVTATVRTSSYTINSQTVSPTTSIINNVYQSAAGTSGINRLIINDKVGIGETTPLAKLHIKDGDAIIEQGNLIIGSSSNAEGGEDGGGTGRPTLWFTESEGTSVTSVSMGIEYDGDGQSGSANRISIVNGSSTELVVFQQGGNVGIGTTSPAYKLDVSGNSRIDATSAGATLTLGRYSGQPTIKADTDDGGHLIMDSTSNYMSLNHYTNQNIIMALGGGNVGVGVSPGQKLDVNGFSRFRDTMYFGASDDQGVISWNTNGFVMLGQSGKGMAFGANGVNNHMYINTSGNVGIGTTSPDTKLDVRGGIQKTNTRVNNSQRYPLGHYTPGETVFEIDPTWTQEELRAYFNSSNVSWSADSSAPGGYSIQITGAPSFGGVYGAGFPYIPIDQDDEFYMEMWIRSEAGAVNTHYLGSNEFNQSFVSLGGNPGSFGYWVMSNTQITDTWTKVSGYIGGFNASNIGDFEVGTKYWTPMMLANYTNVSGTRTSYISGWKVIRVSHPGNRFFKGNLHTVGEIKLSRGSDEYSNYIRSANYPSQGFTSSTAKYWIEYGAKGGHHFVVDTDGGTGGGANAMDNFTVWKGAVDGTALFQVSNSGNASVSGTMTVAGNKVPWVRTQGTTYQSGVNFTLSGTTLYISTTL